MSAFSDAAVVSARDIWAVGDLSLNNGGSGTGPFVRRWNGHRWTIVRLPATYRDASVDAVAASSATNVWLFGEYDNNNYVFALRWNGSWKQMGRWPNVTGGADSALVLGPNDVWLFGEVGTLHYNGRRWHSYKVSVRLLAASAISPSDIWAVGYPVGTGGFWLSYGDPFDAPAVVKFTAGRWRTFVLPHPRGKQTVANVLARV
ncbi:MAG TPA: hypothetical protein VEV63_10815, partial [Streptosporangiaceae bacterium]|nr:hypothetical protein [Streptosporangiaceae bacterium]